MKTKASKQNLILLFLQGTSRCFIELKDVNKFICCNQTQQYFIFGDKFLMAETCRQNKILFCLAETNKFIIFFQY